MARVAASPYFFLETPDQSVEEAASAGKDPSQPPAPLSPRAPEALLDEMRWPGTDPMGFELASHPGIEVVREVTVPHDATPTLNEIPI